jgi:DNA-binding XRE family transcriptional regulator
MRNTTTVILDDLKDMKGIESDYKLAKLLEVRQQTITNYRSGRTQMDEKIAFRAARMLGRAPGPIVLQIYGERSKDTQISRMWFEMSRVIAKHTR